MKRLCWPSDLEMVGAQAFIMRGLWMVYPAWQSIPVDVQGYLIPPWFTEAQWGLILLSIGVTQFTLGCIRRGHVCRASVATFGALVQGMACISYFNSGYFYRGVVPLIIVVIGIEMVIALRGWRDFVAGRRRAQPDRRGR